MLQGHQADDNTSVGSRQKTHPTGYTSKGLSSHSMTFKPHPTGNTSKRSQFPEYDIHLQKPGLIG